MGLRRGSLSGASPRLSPSVSRILSRTAIHLDGSSPTRSSGLPGTVRRATGSLLGLAPGGVCRSAAVAGDAGGLLHHRFTLACALYGPSAVCSLLHFPSGRPAWKLSSTLPCGVRTFLGLSTAAVRQARHRFYSESGRLLPPSQPVIPATATEMTASQITVGAEAGLPPNRAMTRMRKARTRPVTMPWKRCE